MPPTTEQTHHQSTVTTESERDRLVLQNLPLVRAIAVRVYENLPVHVELDDLIHAGIMGLFDSLRDMDWASRDLRRRHKRLEEITRELASSMERNPTELEIAEKMGMDVDRWRQVAIELRMVGLMSASSRAPENENQSVPEFPAGNELNPDVLTGQREVKAVLAKAIQSLPDRYQAVVRHYYAGGKTMREIGDMLGINESRVSQIHRAALEKMNESLKAVGIHSAESILQSR
jgi:RNA polymerase sigma factor for flagellar operon FliA